MILKFSGMSFVFKLCVFSFLLSCASGDAGHDWCYLNPTCSPSHWKGVCSTGKAQSPVDLVAKKATHEGTKHINMSLDYCKVHDNFNIRNNGHSVEIHLNDEAQSVCHALSGEGLPDDYILAQVHLHWGPGDNSGTEHAIDGKRYALEMHMVHLKFDHLKKVMIQGEGNDTIAVIGILFETSAKDNPAIEPLIQILPNVNKTKKDAIVPVKGKNIDFLAFLPKNRTVFRYYGSLTTPPCSEKVLWTVFQTTATISKQQINSFRSLLMPDGHPFKDNARPLQAANKRKLKLFQLDIKCALHLDEKTSRK